MFIITWPIWLSILALSFAILLIYLVIVNTIFPHRLGYLNLLITQGNNTIPDIIPMINKSKVTLGNQNCDIVRNDITTKITFSGRRGGPLLVLLGRIVRVKFDGVAGSQLMLNNRALKAKKYYKQNINDSLQLFSTAHYTLKLTYKNNAGSGVRRLLTLTLIFIGTCIILGVVSYFFIHS